MRTGTEKEEMSSSIWDGIQEEYKTILENEFNLKTQKDCVNTKDEVLLKLMEEYKFPTLVIHRITQKITEFKSVKQITKYDLRNIHIPKKPYFDYNEQVEIVEYVSNMLKYIKRNKILDWKKFVISKFKTLKKEKFDNLSKLIEELKVENVEEAEHLIVGCIEPDAFGSGINAFQTMVYIQQGQTKLKLFSKKLSILLKAIGNSIPDKFKIILIESKFKFEILQRVKEYDNFLQFRSEEVLSLIYKSRTYFQRL